MFYFRTLIFCLTLILIHQTVPQTTISSPIHSGKGQWSQWSNCLNNTFVTGMRVNYDPHYQDIGLVLGKKDDVGLTGVEFYCGSLNSSKNWNDKTLQKISGGGVYIPVQWAPAQFCTTFAVGVQFRHDRPWFKVFDHVELTSLKLICANGDVKTQGLSLGKWYKPMMCPEGYALCGVKTEGKHLRTTKDTWIPDNTGLNNIEVECCKVPLEYCKPVDKWVKVHQVDNTQNDREAITEYKKRVYISKRNEQAEAENTQNGIDFEAAVTLPEEIAEFLDISFKFKLGVSKTTNYNWTSHSFSAKETTSKIMTKVQPRKLLSIYQVIGMCGEYEVHADSFELVATNFAIKLDLISNAALFLAFYLVY